MTSNDVFPISSGLTRNLGCSHRAGIACFAQLWSSTVFSYLVRVAGRACSSFRRFMGRDAFGILGLVRVSQTVELCSGSTAIHFVFLLALGASATLAAF